MSGKAGRSGRRRRKTLADHVMSGTYRPDRHGPLPSNVVPMPPEPPPWAPSPDGIAALGPAGRDFLTKLLGECDCSVLDGVLVLEAAHVVDALTTWRVGAAVDKQSARLAFSHTKTLAALLAQLQTGRR